MSPLGFVPPPCHCEECRRHDVAIPLDDRGITQRRNRAQPVAPLQKMRGLLRCFGDSLLAMTKVLGKHGVGAKHPSPLQGDGREASKSVSRVLS